MTKATSDIPVRPPHLKAGPPDANDDFQNGFIVGDTLIDTVNFKAYTSVKDTNTAAVWEGSAAISAHDIVGAFHTTSGDPGDIPIVGTGPALSLGQLAAKQSSYLVGPTGTAKYSDIQSAIDQAVTDGFDDSNPVIVPILPGDYTENLSLKPGIFLEGVIFRSERDGDVPLSPDRVNVFGTLTYDHDDAGATQHDVELRGIYFENSSTSTTLTLTGSARKILTLQDCGLRTTNASAEIFDDSGQTQLYYVRAYGSQISGDFSGTASWDITQDLSGILLAGTQFGVYSDPGIRVTGDNCSIQIGAADAIADNVGVTGRIEVDAAASSCLLRFQSAVIRGNGALDVQIDGTLFGPSYWYNCLSGDSSISLLRIGGTNGSTFIEKPAGAADDMWKYDGNQWQLAAAATIVAGNPPQAHASSHQDSGSDEIATVTAAAGAIPKADGTGKLPIGFIPASVIGALNYQGTWNASTNTPTLADGTGTKGHYYVVSAAGSQDLGSGLIAFNISDWVVHNGTIYEKIDNTDLVTSVFARTGAVTAQANDYTHAQLASVNTDDHHARDHASTHTAGAADPVTVENLATASVAGQVAVSKADGTLLMKKYYIIEPTDDLVTILNGLGNNSFVWLADGTHTVASQINISGSNIDVRGSVASILNITYAGDNPIAITAPSDDITFDGFSVVYNGGAGGQTPLFAPIGSGAAVIRRLTVRNIHANFATGAITFVRADGEDIDVYSLTVERNQLFGVATKGLFRWPIAASRKLKAVRIMYNNVDRDTVGGSQGIALYGAAGAEIEDVVIRGNTINNIPEQIWINDNVGTIKKIVMDVNNITFDGSGNSGPEIVGSGISDVTIIGNIFDNAGDEHCLLLNSGTNYKVANNTFVNGNKDGLKIGSGLTDSTIDNNLAVGCGENGIDNQGDDIDIRNNTCRDNTGYGIAEPSATDGCNYFGNHCEGNVAGEYSLHGSSTNRTRLDRDGALYVVEGLRIQDLDTSATGAQLDTLTDGSNAYDLHHHQKQASTLTPTGTTQAIDFDAGDSVTVDLGSATGDVTLTMSNPKAGHSYLIKFIQGATFRDVVLPANVLLPGGSATSTLNITEVDDAIDALVLYYDGANYLANLTQNYG